MASRRFFANAAFFLVACGGGGNSGDLPDAVAVDSDPNIDMPPQPGTCAYTEAADATNNTAASPETTGISFSGPVAICGKINNGHFSSGAVDVDRFKVAVAANSELLVHLTGAGFDGLQRVAVQIVSSNSMQLFNNGIVEGDHGTASLRLAAGDYVIAVVAANAADIAAPIDYKVTLLPDQPATRCAKVATANFTEANDGANNVGNDVITFDQGADPQTKLTTNATDNPEPSAIAAAAGTKYRISGSSAIVTPIIGSYRDKDTYLLTTGPTTNQLSIRTFTG
jgi:hypothetical protein